MINAKSGLVLSHDFYGNEYEVEAKDLVWRPSAYGIVIKDGSILLTKQRKAYHLPGGGVDLGEMPEDAVVREIKEETGLDVKNPVLKDQISGFFTWKDQKTGKLWHYQSVLLYYSCDFVGGELSTDGFEEDEALEGELAEWIPIEDLDQIKAGSTIDWRSMLKKHLK